MRFPFAGALLLVTSVAASAQPYLNPYTVTIPYAHQKRVESGNAFPRLAIRELLCPEGIHRLEQLAVNLNRQGYFATNLRAEVFPFATYILSTWQNPKTGENLSVLHHAGTTCVWETASPPGLTANAEPKTPPQ